MHILIAALVAAYNAKLAEMNEHDRWTVENILVPEDVLTSFGWLV